MQGPSGYASGSPRGPEAVARRAERSARSGHVAGRSRGPAGQPGACSAPAPQRGGAECASAEAPTTGACAWASGSSSPLTGQCFALPQPERLVRRCGLRPGPQDLVGSPKHLGQTLPTQRWKQGIVVAAKMHEITLNLGIGRRAPKGQHHLPAESNLDAAAFLIDGILHLIYNVFCLCLPLPPALPSNPNA